MTLAHDRLFAVGARCEWMAVICPAVLISSRDGLDWEVVSRIMSGVSSPRALALSEEGFVAVGQGGDGDDSSDAVWYSADGATWERFNDPAVFGPDPGQDPKEWSAAISSVAAGASGFVAVGAIVCDACMGVARPHRGASWFSPDGRRWRQVPNRGDLPWMHAVVAGPDGFVATSGESMWRSADGRSWRETRIDMDPDHEFVRDITRTSSTFLAVGQGEVHVEDPHPGIWVSVDGAGWARAPDDPIFGTDPLETIASKGDLAATVSYVSDDLDEGLAIWWVRDGVDWHREVIEGPGGPPDGRIGIFEAAPTQITLINGRPLLVGTVRNPDTSSSEAAVWIRSEPLP